MGVLFFAILVAISGFAQSASFYLYSCPLSSSASFLSSSSNSDCSSSGKRRDIPYGIKHTYVQIGGTCYDWGDWNYPRHISCNDPDLACCVRTHSLEYVGFSDCTNKIGTFETTWVNQKKQYHPLSWNCQVYSNAMKEFLLNGCNVNAIPAFG